MKLIERLGAKHEPYLLDLVVVKVYIDLQEMTELAVIVKRKDKRDHTMRSD